MINRFPDMDTYFTEINHDFNTIVCINGCDLEATNTTDFCFRRYIGFFPLNDNLWFFLYNFLFVVYFYSNKIWCIEKLVLQYTIKPIDFTDMSTSLECALKNFQQDNYVQLYKRSSRKLGTGFKYKNMEVTLRYMKSWRRQIWSLL
jgi:hypothetical protein